MSYDKVRQAKGFLAIGSKQTKKAIEQRTVEEVYIAEDADRKIIQPLISLCKQHGVAIKRVDSMDRLGTACGIEVGAATVAILQRDT